jgi:hypothetical protein
MKIDIEHVRCLGSTGRNLTSGLDDVGEADDVTSKRTPHAGLQHGQIQSSAAAAVEGNSHHAAATEARTDSSRGIADKNETPADTLGGESEEHRARDNETREVAVEGDGRGTSVMTLSKRGRAKLGTGVTTSAISASRPPASAAETMEMGGQRDADPSPEDDSLSGSSGEEESAAGNSGDEIERPQFSTSLRPPKDFDWRKLKPRRYGRSLPPLDPAERDNLEQSIKSHGFLSRILIDELLNIVDGNHRWTICMETGIAPAVKVIRGLSEDKKQRELEKEELALSCNLDRRQLDKEDAAQVFEARLDNLLKLQQENAKKWTLKKIAKVLGVSIATVAARRDLRLNSDGGTMSKPDARRKYDDHQKREAVRLVKEGMPKADVARQLCMSVKAVERAEKEEKEREAGGAPAKKDKGKKKTPARRKEPIEDLAASDGVPRVHQPAVQDLGLNAQGYMELVKAERARALENSKAVADEKHGNLKQAVYHAHMAEIFNSRLQPSLSDAGDAGTDEVPPGDSCPEGAGYEAGEILRGTVLDIKAEVVFVKLPKGDGGVINARDEGLTWQAPPKGGGDVRVRVNGFDSKRGCWDLQLVGQQTVAPAPAATAARSDSDDRSSPYPNLAGRKAGPKEMGVTK